ncbi:hypothetical protein RHMOL_Rhmol06G0102800 [Rhododendron molle]|uniref:Uncharacterized protein n=1 Tax=Rhododendron molle TaxID=49168 RepID=A0ACC0NBD2_RHOML|nr:hypothetical protein RHMOL_Rhmol06G0102800 [Rhododendron molle]
MAGGERREGAGDEEMTAGRVIATPVLRATTVEPRGGDSGIGASHPVPFVEGDFLDSARPRDILDALGLDATITEMLRGARTTEDQASALLLGALLSGAGGTTADTGSPEADAMGGEELDEEAVVEERVTAAAGAKAYLASARPGFVPKTYAPRLHFFKPMGMTDYTPARTDYPEDLLLRDRDTHISFEWTMHTRDIYGHGGLASSLKYFKELPRRVRELMEEAGFGPFIQLMTAVRVDRAVLTALTERWWDTTNTFHFRFGEMTVTPLDFTAITGLRVGGEPIPYDPSIDLDDTALEWFLGRVPRHCGGVGKYGQFTKYWDHEPAGDAEVAQMARAYLLYLFGASLFPNRRSRVHLNYLPGLVDLRQAGRYDWGGAALCTLYCFLGAASRGVGDTVGGYWRVVEARVEADFLPRSWEVTRSRVLLECPLGWQWYLGDRVARQSLGSPEFIVPGPLPPRVQRTETYTRAELEQFTVPDADLEKYLRRTLDYAAYRDRYLATSLGVQRELERRIAEAEARRARGEAGGEVGDETVDETGARGHGGRSLRGRGRGVRPPVGGRGASSSGRGESSTRILETAETSASPGLPSLEWTIGVRDPFGARALLDIPRLLRPPMRLPAQVPREWAEKAIMLMVGMRQLLKDCAKRRTLQIRLIPEPILPVAAQRRPTPEESEDETEESLESRALGSTDSSTASGPPDDEDGDSNEVESSESEGHQRKRTRRD